MLFSKIPLHRAKILVLVSLVLEGIWGMRRAVSGLFPCAVLDAVREW